jgi:hypothetical protein
MIDEVLPTLPVIWVIGLDLTDANKMEIGGWTDQGSRRWVNGYKMSESGHC